MSRLTLCVLQNYFDAWNSVVAWTAGEAFLMTWWVIPPPMEAWSPSRYQTQLGSSTINLPLFTTTMSSFFLLQEMPSERFEMYRDLNSPCLSGTTSRSRLNLEITLGRPHWSWRKKKEESKKEKKTAIKEKDWGKVPQRLEASISDSNCLSWCLPCMCTPSLYSFPRKREGNHEDKHLISLQ